MKENVVASLTSLQFAVDQLHIRSMMAKKMLNRENDCVFDCS